MHDVAARLLGRQCRELHAQAHLRGERGGFRCRQALLEQRQSNERSVQQAAVRCGTGDGRQLGEHRRIRGMRVVEEQQRPAAGRALLREIVGERAAQRRVLAAEWQESALVQQQLQQFPRCGRRCAAVHDQGLRPQLLAQRQREHALAGAGLAGDDDERIPGGRSRFHVGLGTRVRLAQVEEARVGLRLERRFPEPEGRQVHGLIRNRPRLLCRRWLLHGASLSASARVRNRPRTRWSRSRALGATSVQCPSLRPGRADLP